LLQAYLGSKQAYFLYTEFLTPCQLPTLNEDNSTALLAFLMRAALELGEFSGYSFRMFEDMLWVNEQGQLRVWFSPHLGELAPSQEVQTGPFTTTASEANRRQVLSVLKLVQDHASCRLLCPFHKRLIQSFGPDMQPAFVLDALLPYAHLPLTLQAPLQPVLTSLLQSRQHTLSRSLQTSRKREPSLATSKATILSRLKKMQHEKHEQTNLFSR
jgi:hypothetical protein